VPAIVPGNFDIKKLGKVSQGQKPKRAKNNINDIETTETEIYKILKAFKLQQYAKVIHF